MKLKNWTNESVLKVAATLISDNVVAQEDWVNRHKGSDLVSDLSDIEDNYIAVMCFAPVYFMKGSITRLHINRECIRDIKVMKDFKPIFYHLFLFVDSAYVIFKKQSDGNFIELPYKYGYEKVNGTVNEFHGGLVLPLPENSKFWIDIDGERVWIDSPKSAYENNYLDINRNCWMDCTYFESVMGGGEIDEDEMCEECPIRNIMGKTLKLKPFKLGVKEFSIKKEWVETERLIEVFTPSILRVRNDCIRKERHNEFGSSLSKQFKFVENLKKTIVSDGNNLSFTGLGECIGNKKIEAYNFFLLSYVTVSDDATGLTVDLDIKIYGFNTYSDLNKFVVENLMYTEGLLLFVKDEGTYREALCSLTLKSSNETMNVSWVEFITAKKSDYVRKFAIPQLCEFFELEGTVEEAKEFYEQEVVVIYGETLEKEIPFDYTVSLCNSELEVESCIYSRNLHDKADLIEGLIKYGYVVLTNNVFEGTLYKYFITCKDGIESFEMKKIQGEAIIRSDT